MPANFSRDRIRLLSDDIFQAAVCADQLKALSDPLRLRIIDALRLGEMSVSDIALALDVDIVTVSHHLGILKQANLVESERDGRFIYYRLRSDLLQKRRGKTPQVLNLGCCRLEVPTATPTPKCSETASPPDCERLS